MTDIRRAKGTAQEGKTPAVTREIRAMVATLSLTLRGRRDRALLLLSFAGAFQRSKLVSLDVGDLTWSDDSLTVRPRRSTLDQEGARLSWLVSTSMRISNSWTGLRHVPQAVMALDAGVHVLSEVPAAVSMEQARELVAATRRSAAVYMLAENYCYTRTNLIVRAMAHAGAFGDLYFGEGEYLHEMKSYHHNAGGQPTWRYHWQVGRDGHTYPTHSLGPVLQWMNDRLEAVSCVGTGRHTDPEHAIQDTIMLLGRTTRGGLVKIRLDLLSNRPHLMDYYSLQGTGGAYEAARASGQTPRVYLHGRGPEGAWEPLENHADEFLPDRYKRKIEGAGHWGSDAWPVGEFIEAITRGTRPPIDVYAALDMSLPGIISEQSIAQGGAWLPVPNPRMWTAGIGVEPGRESPLA